MSPSKLEIYQKKGNLKKKFWFIMFIEEKKINVRARGSFMTKCAACWRDGRRIF